MRTVVLIGSIFITALAAWMVCRTIRPKKREGVGMDKMIGLIADEDWVHARSVQMVQGDAQLKAMFDVVELSIDILFLVASGDLKTDDDRALSALCARLFNSIAASRRVAFCGYVPTAFGGLRDLLDTLTLLHYFRLDRSAIERWRKVQQGAVPREFQQAEMRKRIEKDDPRAATFLWNEYGLYSHFAAHATHASLLFLQGAGNTVMPGPEGSLARLPSFVTDLARFACLLPLPMIELLNDCVRPNRGPELLAMQQRLVELGVQVGFLPRDWQKRPKTD